MQTGMEKNLFGNHPVSLSASDSRAPPPAFASEPLVDVSAPEFREKNSSLSIETVGINLKEGYSAGISSVSDIVEIDGPSSSREPKFMKSSSPVRQLSLTYMIILFLQVLFILNMAMLCNEV